MQRLATPTQYEPSIEGLNDIRPLQLAEDSKIVIPYPVLCKNPSTIDKPAIGKLARCSQQGALLTDKRKVYTAFEYIEQDFEMFDENQVIQFSQKVSCVQSLMVAAGTWSAAYWTDPTYTAELMDIKSNQTVFMSFVGTDLYVKVTNVVPGFVTKVGFHGFY